MSKEVLNATLMDVAATIASAMGYTGTYKLWIDISDPNEWVIVAQLPHDTKRVGFRRLEDIEEAMKEIIEWLAYQMGGKRPPAMLMNSMQA